MHEDPGQTTKVGIHFQYPIQHDPILNKLRAVAGIEIDPAKGDIENAKAIIGFAHGLFAHNGDNEPSAADPLTILQEAKAGQSFRCVEYSTLAAGLLWAYGIPARTLGLKTSDVETRQYGAGHVVIEFWSKDFDKWAMSDVQAGVMPFDGDTPLSAYELGQKLSQGADASHVPVSGSRFSPGAPYGKRANYAAWINEYLYFIDTPINLTLGNEDKRKQQIAMLVPTGATEPRVFQGMFTMNAVYTRSPADFYQKPLFAIA